MDSGAEDTRPRRRLNRRLFVVLAIGVAAAVSVGLYFGVVADDEPPSSLIYIYASPPDGESRVAESTSVFRTRGTWELRFDTAAARGPCDSIYRVAEQRSSGPPVRIDEIRGEARGTRRYNRSGSFVVTVEYMCEAGAVATTSIQVVQQ